MRASQGGPMPTGNPRIVTLSPDSRQVPNSAHPMVTKIIFSRSGHSPKIGLF